MSQYCCYWVVGIWNIFSFHFFCFVSLFQDFFPCFTFNDYEKNDAHFFPLFTILRIYRVVDYNNNDIDDDLYFPIDIPADTRYYVLPSGELLIAAIRTNDLRRQFRCRMAHRLTGERYDSSNWARIKLRGKWFYLFIHLLCLWNKIAISLFKSYL